MKEYKSTYDAYISGHDEAYANCINSIESFEFIISALEEKQHRGWIPVSERLPDKRQYEDGEPIEYNIMIKGATASTTGCINQQGTWGEMCWAKASFYPYKNEVIAWMPLPESYKEDKP